MTRAEWEDERAFRWPAGLVPLEEMPEVDTEEWVFFNEDLASGALRVPDDDSGLIDFNTGERA